MGKAARKKRIRGEDPNPPSNVIGGRIEPKKSLIYKKTVHIALIIAIGLIAYSNTLNAPFHLDDFVYIRDNPIVKELNYFFEPSKAERFALYDSFKRRYVGYLTFALNYQLHNLDIAGYHIFNIAIHILNALLVYYLVIVTFRTRFLSHSGLNEHSPKIALFSALLFVSHPLQTEAVTYIFQRFASLAAFFYLSSLVSYVKSRLSERKKVIYGLYALSLFSAILAMKTKENAFTLPFVILLYEISFSPGSKFNGFLRSMPFFLTSLIIPLSIISGGRPAGFIIGGAESALMGRVISQWDYFFTQLRVIVTYIRLLIVPVNQNFDYSYPVYSSFFKPQVFLSAFFLSSILCSAFYLHLCSRKKNELRPIAFGIFWFFITLSVESGLIPIPMTIAEYRVYLPSVGIFVAAGAAFVNFLYAPMKKYSTRIYIVVLIVIAASLTFLSFSRNLLWTDDVSLWRDTVKKSPYNPRAHSNLGYAYESAGMIDKAIAHYEIALSLDPERYKTHVNLGFLYFYYKKEVDKAIEHFEATLNFIPDSAQAHLNLAIAYKAKGLTDKAKVHFDEARRLRPALLNMQ